MKFTVLWTPTAEEHLARIWLDAPDRQSVVDAAASIDSLLAIDPLDCGESREGNLRIAFRRPLGIDFKVFPDDQLVYVLAI
jgi:hypothetical protein